MRRAWSTFLLDIRMQYAHGLHALALATTVGWLFAFHRYPAWLEQEGGLLLRCALGVFLLVTVFLFAAFEVWNQRRTSAFQALSATPLRPHEYLAAKTASLGGLAWAQCLILYLGTRGGTGKELLFLVLGASAASVLLVLAAVLSLAFPLLPPFPGPTPKTGRGSLQVTITLLFLGLPILVSGAGYGHAPLAALLAWLHPLQGPWMLLSAAFAPVAAWQWALGILGTAFWAALALALCPKGFARLRMDDRN